jgi:hypothetical protein
MKKKSVKVYVRKEIQMFSDYRFYETTLACSTKSSLRLLNQKRPLLYYYIVLTCVNAQFETAAREKFYNFLAGTIRTAGGAPEAIGSNGREIHLLVGFDSFDTAPADFIRRLKLLSASWARKKIGATDFAWSEKVQAITISESQRERVRRRIFNQNNRRADVNCCVPETLQISVAAAS